MTKVEVDWVKCNGCGTCADNCPVSVFELQDLKDYSDSKKSVPVRARRLYSLYDLCNFVSYWRYNG